MFLLLLACACNELKIDTPETSYGFFRRWFKGGSRGWFRVRSWSLFIRYTHTHAHLPSTTTLRASGTLAWACAVATDESKRGVRGVGTPLKSPTPRTSGYSNTDLSDRLPTFTGPLAGRFGCLSQLREVVFPSDPSAVHCSCTAGMQRFAHVSLTTHTHAHILQLGV